MSKNKKRGKCEQLPNWSGLKFSQKGPLWQFNDLFLLFIIFYMRHTNVSSVVKVGVQDQGGVSWEGGKGAEQSLFQSAEWVVAERKWAKGENF